MVEYKIEYRKIIVSDAGLGRTWQLHFQMLVDGNTMFDFQLDSPFCDHGLDDWLAFFGGKTHYMGFDHGLKIGGTKLVSEGIKYTFLTEQWIDEVDRSTYHHFSIPKDIFENRMREIISERW
jgi:hypothetical protein